MSRLARATRRHDGDLLFIVAGELGAVELRHCPNYACFYVHFPAEPELNILMGAVPHQCHILEGGCWEGLVACGGYDFDAPDVDTVPQWPALEELYEFYLEGGRG